MDIRTMQYYLAVVREGYAAHPEEVDFLVYLGDVFRLNKQ